MGDRPWKLPHEQANSYPQPEMIQASTSSIHGSNTIRKDPGGYDMAELDHLFLYLNSQDQTPVQEQPQTLNIFPSRPMHVVEPSSKQESMANDSESIAAGAAAGGGAGPSPSPTTPEPPPARKKDGKAAVKREVISGGGGGGKASSSSEKQEGPRTSDAKTLRRLAQNREAARKSRLRKKAYIQNLETSRIRLSQLEQELQRPRTQDAIFGGGAISAGIGGLSPEAAWFDGEYARWVEEHDRMMGYLRTAELHQADADQGQLRQLVDAAAAHHGVLVELKAAVAKADVFHLVSGAWLSAAERCFLWIGGFRPSEIIKVIRRHVEPLTEAQVVGLCGIQQWVKEAEAALNHNLQAAHCSLSDAISSDALLVGPNADMASYMAHMSLAIANLTSLEAFVQQADGLRLQTLQRLPQILTARQSARCFLAITDYSQRLRALSSLLLARPPPPPPPPLAGGGRIQP